VARHAEVLNKERFGNKEQNEIDRREREFDGLIGNKENFLSAICAVSFPSAF
jgi:hypothetical protein